MLYPSISLPEEADLRDPPAPFETNPRPLFKPCSNGHEGGRSWTKDASAPVDTTGIVLGGAGKVSCQLGFNDLKSSKTREF